MLTEMEYWDLMVGGIPYGGMTVVIVPDATSGTVFITKTLEKMGRNCIFVDAKGDMGAELAVPLRVGMIHLKGIVDINAFEAGMMDETIHHILRLDPYPKKTIIYINGFQEFCEGMLKKNNEDISKMAKRGLTFFGVLYRHDAPFNPVFANEMDSVAQLILETKRVNQTFADLELLKDERGFTSRTINVQF